MENKGLFLLLICKMHLFVFLHLIVLSESLTEKEDIECGRSLATANYIIEDRIVGGYDIGYYKYPWYVALVQFGTIECGASLIGVSVAVTAAHCFKLYLRPSILTLFMRPRLESIYTARLGIYNRCKRENTQQDFAIRKVVIHEAYDPDDHYHDIALLFLDGDTSQFTPICLPLNAMEDVKPKEGFVPGLGTLTYQGQVPCTMHEARLLIYNNKQCKQMINGTGNDPNQVYKAFCAGYLEGGVDACQGDSGGPFQIVNDSGKMVLLGIVSYGFKCAEPGVLGMYTDVARYLEWIHMHITNGSLHDAKQTNRTSLPPLHYC